MHGGGRKRCAIATFPYLSTIFCSLTSGSMVSRSVDVECDKVKAFCEAWRLEEVVPQFFDDETVNSFAFPSRKSDHTRVCCRLLFDGGLVKVRVVEKAL